jgi:hypothetical protein
LLFQWKVRYYPVVCSEGVEDLDCQAALKVAKDCDPSGSRTIGTIQIL